MRPLSAGSYELRTTLDQEAHDLLARIQTLEGLPAGPRGVSEALKRALRARVAQLEKRKFGATDRPRAARSNNSRNPRHVPAHVKRAVAKRDQGRCTFVGDGGHRCESRRVEFDHIVPVARGGSSTVANLRLRCRAHNQYAAEREFGAAFMNARREQTRVRAARMRERSHARATAALERVTAIVAGATETPHAP